ncbi:hypothetical protein HK101_004446, partial [Irineochytrium annulatum]
MEEKVRKKITSGSVDVDKDENAIVVNYYVQSTNANGNPSNERKAMRKIVRVKSLTATTDLAAMARDIIDKCKVIHPSKLKDVEQVLYYLQQRTLGGGNGGMEGREDASNRAWLKKQLEEARQAEVDTFAKQSNGEVSSLDLIEHYIEGLYEEVPEKITATRNILSLARVPENMETLISNEALMSALSRVLREENKKSMELVTNIFYIFFCFSNYSHFHHLITANKIGDMCLRVTDQELNRFNIWVQDLENLEHKCEQNPNNGNLARELEQEHRKFQAMLQKQDQLLFVCFHLLLNLAEDLNIEVKMIKRDIVKYLLIMLDRKTPELLILVVTFLKKLSIFKENKDEMVKNMGELLRKLHDVIPSDNQALQSLTLRLLLNLSHDPKMRTGLVRMGYLEKLTDLLTSKTHVILTLQLLYQLSIDDNTRSAFANTDAVPLIIKMILEYKGDRVNVELMALAINIATDPHASHQICSDSALKFLVRRALKMRDTLILKMLRNVASHEGDCKLMFLDHVDDIMHLLFKNLASAEVVVECLGILGDLTIQDFDFAKLGQAYGLLEFVQNRLAVAVAAAVKSVKEG